MTKNLIKIILFFFVLIIILIFTLLNADTIDDYALSNTNLYQAEEKATTSQSDTLETKSYIMTATAYDLSIRSCGKPYGHHGHPARGITTSGRDLNNKSRHVNVISSNEHPLGTQLELTFPEEYSRYNGIYTVEDTGNMRKGVLDVFIGDFGEEVSQKAINFGVRQVEVKELEG